MKKLDMCEAYVEEMKEVKCNPTFTKEEKERIIGGRIRYILLAIKEVKAGMEDYTDPRTGITHFTNKFTKKATLTRIEKIMEELLEV